MLQMVLLEGLVVLGQIAVVQEVVCHVVAGVTKDTASIDGHSHVPVPVKDGEREMIKWVCQYEEQSGWHHQTVLVHGKIVMHTVQGEMQSNANAIIRQVAVVRWSVISPFFEQENMDIMSNVLIQVEQEPVKQVFN